MPEDLSHWTVPALIQANVRKPATPVPPAFRLPTAAEKVYDYVPGGVYTVTVALDAPLDVIFEPGEKVQTLLGVDPKPIDPGTDQQKPKSRWAYQEAMSGLGETATRRVFVQAVEAGASLGLTVTTTKRVYYLKCQSVKTSPIRAVRWTYPPEVETVLVQDAPAPRLLPAPDEAHQYHAGYALSTSTPAPSWTPRFVVDDGKKFYIVYPETTLFGTVPLVRLLGPNGPQVVNSRQYLNVVMLDLADVPKLELRVGTGDQAQTVTITRSALRTITCPGDPACPVWPAAADLLAEGARP